MILLIAVIIFFVIIACKSIYIFKRETFEENKTEEYKINPKYVETDISLEKTMKNYKIMEFEERKKW